MKRTTLAIAVMTALIAGCASAPTANAPLKIQPEKVADNIPGWFMKPPESTNEEIFAVGTALSRDLSMSVIKAQLDAETHLANKVAGEVSSLTKDYKQDVADEFMQNTRTATNKLAKNVKIIGAVTVKKVILPEGGGFRTYVLVKFPLGSNNQMMQNYNSKQMFKGSQEETEKELERKSQEPAARAIVSPVADNSGIVIRSTRATSTSGPLGLSDSGEEN